MEIAAPQSLVGANVSRTSGYLDPILASPFRADRDGLPSTPSPAPIRVRVHPLLSFTLLRSPSCVAPAGRVATSSAFRGVSSLFATSVPRVHISAGVPGRPSFRPRRFARPRRLPPRCTWWACFIPLPRPGFSLQGFAPATQPYRLVGGRCPLVVGDGSLPRVLPSAPGVRHVALRALLRHRDPLCLGRSLTSTRTRVPSCGFAPSGFASWVLATPSRHLRSRPWRVDPACDSGRRPSASRSIHDPSLCPQRFLPFELCGLRDRGLVPVTTRGPSTSGP